MPLNYLIQPTDLKYFYNFLLNSSNPQKIINKTCKYLELKSEIILVSMNVHKNIFLCILRLDDELQTKIN